MGEGIIEAEVTRWLVKEGQAIEADQPLVEVATDKVDSEIPAPESGVIHKILVGEGEVPKVGQVLAILSTDTSDASVAEIPEEQTEPLPPAPSLPKPERVHNVPEQIKDDLAAKSGHLAEMAFLSPLVRKLARQHTLGPAEIAAIQGSGVAGRITRGDIKKFVESRDVSAGSLSVPLAENSQPAPSLPEVPSDPTQTRTEMGRMRQIIAEHMVYSKRVAPHVTSFVEADVTELTDWRSRVKKTFETRFGQKLTVTTLILEAVIKALKEYPDINVSVEGHTILHKKELNIGMATALPDGNLIVPVIRKADTLNLAGLAGAVNDLAERARSNELKPEEIQGGTFTVTNIGSFGNIAGTPIINQPEVAILAAGVIRKMPAVVETPRGDAIGIRQMLILSLAYDHRVVDGVLGGSFLKRIADHLQNFDSKRII